MDEQHRSLRPVNDVMLSSTCAQWQRRSAFVSQSFTRQNSSELVIQFSRGETELERERAMMLTVSREDVDVLLGLKQRAVSTTTPPESETLLSTMVRGYQEASRVVSSGTTPTPCRCLFGPVDHAANAADAAALRASMDRLNSARWGFDFVAGQSLPAGRFDWTSTTQVNRRPSAHAGRDFIRDRPALQPVNDGSETIPPSSSSSSSTELVTSSKRRSHAVTSSKRRRRRRHEISRDFDDVIRHVAACAPASQQHRNAKCIRHIITGTGINNYNY